MNKDTKILSEIGKYFSKDGKKGPMSVILQMMHCKV
jgi:hypothetical protein